MSRFQLVIEGVVAAILTAAFLFAVRGELGVGGRGAVEPRSCEGRVVVVASVGDMLLGDRAQKKLDRHGYDYPFRKVASLLADADVVMGNLEAPITEHPTPMLPDKKYIYKQDPRVAQTLRDTGFTVLALANNHTLDYGVQGLLDTITHLDRAGIRWLGAGPDEDAARQGLLLEVDGTTIGLLAYMQDYGSYERDGWFASGEQPGAAIMREEVFAEDIARMRERADVVIVHAHYGKNYAGVKGFQERISHAMIDAGADAVNGHHPHVAQGVEVYKGKPILYSLGNFTFGTGGRFEKGRQGYGLVARYNICDGRIHSVELDLIGTNNRLVKYQPTVIDAEEAWPVMADLNERYGTALRWQGSTAIVDL